MPQDLAPSDLPARCTRFLDRAEQIRIDHVIAGVIELGQAAVEELYDGDIGLAFDRAAARDAPLTLLLERFGARLDYLRLTVDNVRHAIRVYDVNRQLPPGTQGRLLPSQLKTLAAVPSPADRAELAGKAVALAWTVEQTEEEVGSFRLRAGIKGKGGRPPTPAQLRAAEAAGRKIAGLGEPGSLGVLSPSHRARLKAELTRVKLGAERWLAEL